ncbi:hypothetical protein GCM10009628_29510 [Paeniglutamicibacter kerguelensis]
MDPSGIQQVAQTARKKKREAQGDEHTDAQHRDPEFPRFIHASNASYKPDFTTSTALTEQHPRLSAKGRRRRPVPWTADGGTLAPPRLTAHGA